jgi:hypothetical protein
MQPAQNRLSDHSLIVRKAMSGRPPGGKITEGPRMILKPIRIQKPLSMGLLRSTPSQGTMDRGNEVWGKTEG